MRETGWRKLIGARVTFVKHLEAQMSLRNAILEEQCAMAFRQDSNNKPNDCSEFLSFVLVMDITIIESNSPLAPLPQ